MEKHRHCGVLTSGTQNLTTSGSVVNLQFHSDDDDDDDDDGGGAEAGSDNDVQPGQRGRTFKGFWLRFEGSINFPAKIISTYL